MRDADVYPPSTCPNLGRSHAVAYQLKGWAKIYFLELELGILKGKVCIELNVWNVESDFNKHDILHDIIKATSFIIVHIKVTSFIIVHTNNKNEGDDIYYLLRLL